MACMTTIFSGWVTCGNMIFIKAGVYYYCPFPSVGRPAGRLAAWSNRYHLQMNEVREPFEAAIYCGGLAGWWSWQRERWTTGFLSQFFLYVPSKWTTRPEQQLCL